MTNAAELINRLERHYGRLERPPCSGPFEMILWEIVAYLADDARRRKAFDALRDEVGLTPRQILEARPAALKKITRMGGAVAFEERAARLHKAARLVIEEYGGDLSCILQWPAAKAKKALMRFPMIGAPGAEKILLFQGLLPVLALESNGVRVLVRVGVAAEGRNYAATYRNLREATLEQLPADVSLLATAHLLLRRHGQEMCTIGNPACAACPLRVSCLYDRTRSL